ncbi:hypothetical protein Tmar_1201 [Thermaerobacter marianensis DSM 12885]|uniref:Uncharacterized protein n=1 Tax=Thermaerobacter marianensis (strain ATCC 700841 / DSM 12885 / JCM 10246 / 7p75a) TaxID=644966 RepID=E6SL83_THEM7|nr:hypothetical protein Tmar_1201 [Thermaerobacter marianensis DSM 12885]
MMPSAGTLPSLSATAFATAVAVATWMAAAAWPELRAALHAARRRRDGQDGQGGARGSLAWGRWRRWTRSRPTWVAALAAPRRPVAGKAVDAAAEALESVLVTVIAHLQAGRPLRQAWVEAAREVVAPVLEPAKAEFVAGLSAGLSLDEALGQWYERTRLRALRRCQAVAAAHRRTGGDATGPTLAVIHGLREQRLAWADVAARTAEARLSARLLALLPVVVTAYALALDPAFVRPLWNDPLGRWGLSYGVASWLAGIYLLRRLAGTLAGTGGSW